MQKFSQFYVTYRNIVQFDHNLWKLDYSEKSVLELLADPVITQECSLDLFFLIFIFQTRFWIINPLKG